MVPARTLTWMTVAVMAALALAGCKRTTGPTAAERAAKANAEATFVTEQQAWRAQRLANLTKPDGWTSLIGLHWLDAGTHRVGSGRDNGLQLMMGPPHLGLFTVRKGRVHFAADTAVTIDGQASRRALLRTDADPQGASVIGFDDGKGLVTVIERNGRLALRVKYADAPSRLHFSGLTYWPGGMAWQVRARFIPHERGKTLPIANIVGGIDDVANPGVLEFERGGQLYRLEALDEGEGTLFLVFADRTSGHGSYGAGRFIDAPMPDANKRVVIDFNRAYNPPCAFTPFATCPLPPPENRLNLRVEAGEKAYIKPTISTPTPTKDTP